MASIAVTPDQDALVSEIHIAAPPERVFQALIDPAQAMQWWNSPQCPIEAYAMDARPGGRWSYDTQQTEKVKVNGVSKFHCEGEVLECDPPRVLAYTWIANWHEKEARTVVRWELAASKGGTLLRVTHSGLAALEASRKDYSGGWPGVVESIKRFVEGNPKS